MWRPEPAPHSLPQVDAFGPVVAGASGGVRTFGQYCAVCHGATGEGVSGPNLLRSQIRDREALIAFIKNPKGAMPRMYPAYLDDAQVSDAADYVLSLQRKGAAAK
jgi:ubiquinol-cytochrome c reductase cytochrome c subunit